MEFVVRAVTEEEEKYTERPDIITGIQTGYLGNLMSDTGRYGRGFFLNWHDFNRMTIPKDFKSELTEMEMTYRKGGEFLSCRSALIRFCQTLKCYRKDGRTFGLRIDSDDYAYLCSIDPNEKDDTFYCFVYKKECLKRHMREAENGIRFVSPDNTELFRIKDGDSISITYPDGRCVKEECRYINPEHFLIHGSIVWNILKFSERMNELGAKVTAVGK